MPVRLDSRDAGFATDFETLLDSKREASEEVGNIVAAILADVRAARRRGGARIHRALRQAGADAGNPRASPQPRSPRPRARTPADVLDALTFAHDRIRAHHEKQKPADHDLYRRHSASPSARSGPRSKPSASTCRAASPPIPSSVLMNAVPAKVAGASRVAMVVPTPRGENQRRRARRRVHCRHHRNLSRRRRPGHRRAWLRYRRPSRR